MQPIQLAVYFDILGKSQKAYSRQLEPVCRQWDLTRSEVDVLLFLHNNPGYDRATDIVTHRGMAKSHVSMSVSSLSERGLLERLESPEDRRTVRLRLSQEGMAVAAEAARAQRQFFELLYQGLSEEEMSVWQKITQKVCENIENASK